MKIGGFNVQLSGSSIIIHEEGKAYLFFCSSGLLIGAVLRSYQSTLLYGVVLGLLFGDVFVVTFHVPLPNPVTISSRPHGEVEAP